MALDPAAARRGRGGYLTGRHGPCPVCRAGRDRFRFDDKEGRGTWICNQCGAGNGIDLLMNMHDWTFKEAAERVHALVGSAETVMPKPEITEQERLKALREMWLGSKPVTAGDMVARYLAGPGDRARELAPVLAVLPAVPGEYAQELAGPAPAPGADRPHCWA